MLPLDKTDYGSKSIDKYFSPILAVLILGAISIIGILNLIQPGMILDLNTAISGYFLAFGLTTLIYYFYSRFIIDKTIKKIDSAMKRSYNINLGRPKEELIQEGMYLVDQYQRGFLRDTLLFWFLIPISYSIIFLTTGWFYIGVTGIVIVLLSMYRSYIANPVSAHYDGQIDTRVSATGQKKLQ